MKSPITVTDTGIVCDTDAMATEQAYLFEFGGRKFMAVKHRYGANASIYLRREWRDEKGRRCSSSWGPFGAEKIAEIARS